MIAKLLRALAALIVLTLLPVTANCEWWDKSIPPLNRKEEPMPALWWEWVKGGSRLYGSNPFLVASVMDIEANGWKEGRLGKSGYQAPCGFSRDCAISKGGRVPDDEIYDTEKQIRRACRLLAGNPYHCLKKYNATYWLNNYINDVILLAKQMERESRWIKSVSAVADKR